MALLLGSHELQEDYKAKGGGKGPTAKQRK